MKQLIESQLRVMAGNLKRGERISFGSDYVLMDDAADLIAKFRKYLRALRTLGIRGMPPDHTEWLAYHDKVAKLANEALDGKP